MKTLLLTLTTVTACTDTDPVDLDCTDLPGSAQMAGVVLDERGGAPVFGAYVEIHADRTLLGSAFTNADGSYAMAAESDLSTVRHAQADRYLDAYAYDPTPRFDAQPLPMLSRDAADYLSRLAGIEPDPSTGMVLVIAIDCANRPIEGATIDAPGAASVLYLGADTRFDPALGATTKDSAALLVGVPVGPVDISIEIDGQARTTTVESHANSLTTTWGR